MINAVHLLWIIPLSGMIIKGVPALDMADADIVTAVGL